MNNEFYFPLKKEQLLEKPSDNRYWIEDKSEIEDLDSRKQKEKVEILFGTLEQENKQILQQENFSLIYSFLSSYETLNESTKNIFVESFYRTFKNFTKNLEEYLDLNDQAHAGMWRNMLKIFIFFTEWQVEIYLNMTKNKKKEIRKARRKIRGDSNVNYDNKENQRSKSKTNTVSKKKIGLGSRLDSAKEEKFRDKDGNDEGDSSKSISSFNPENILKSLMKIVTSNLKILFRNKIIEEDLINSMIKICFDILEISNENKNKNVSLKEKIFEILQILITKYQANVNVQIILIKLTTKIVNLIYNQESLVNYLADFVVLAINGDSNMNKLAVDIIHEMSKTIFEDDNFDSQGLKNVGKFMVILSEKSPKTIYNNISSLLRLFDSESYVIRNTLVEVISNVIINILCNLDDIQDVDTRNNYLKTKEKFIEILFDRIYDKSGFCRSKVLHIFEKLCDNNTISVNNYNRLLKEASGRLKDEKAHVRKRAISLISKIIFIYSKIFNCDKFLNNDEIKQLIEESNNSIEEASKKIKKIDEKLLEITKNYEENEDEENSNNNNLDANDLKKTEELADEKNNLKEEINKELMIIDYFENYRAVLKVIDGIIPLAIQLLGSKNISDVQETIDLFLILHKLRISSSIVGVKKMLNLIMKPEESIRKKVIEAYQNLFFDKEKPLDVQAAYLVDLTVKLNFSEMTCLRELMKSLISTNSINMNIFKEIWKILIKNPESEITKLKITSQEEFRNKMNQFKIEARAAVVILNLASEFDPNVLLNNSDIYIKNILSNIQKKEIDWLLLKESLIGLQKIYSMKKDIVELCLLKISKVILKGHGTDDNHWYMATQEMINTIFQVVTNPEKISHYIIVKLSKPLFVNNTNKNETEMHFMTQNIESAPKFPQSQGMECDGDPKDAKESNEGLTNTKLAQLLFVVGHVALMMVVYAEKLENNLKKKKNEKSPSKNKDNDDIQEIAGGKEAEIEYDINLLHKMVEEDFLYNNLLGKFVPLIVDISHLTLTTSHSEIENNIFLYKNAILAMCKYMCISQKFCEENLPFLFKFLDSDSIEPNLKLNVCASFADFINRFPNILQKQITKYFSCLHSKYAQVVRYSMIVISHLALNDMLKLKGEIVDICMLLESEDQKLKDLVNLFFYELNQKGNNTIYNVIPKAMAKLSNEYKNLEYQKFQNIVKTLLKYVEKDKHTEGLIEKLFVKLKNSSDVCEWRNNTYCLSQLNYNERQIMKLLDFYSNLKDKIEDDEVIRENFQNIFAKFKRSASANTNKEAIEELEKKFFAGEKIHIAKQSAKNTASNVKVKSKQKIGKKRNFSKMKNSNLESEEDQWIDSESDIKSVNNNNNNFVNSAKQVSKNVNKNNIGFSSSNNRPILRNRNKRRSLNEESDEEDFSD